MPAILRDQKVRNAVLQASFVGVLIVALVSGTINVRDSLAEQGITASFDFLQRSTGWNIGFSVLPFDSQDTYARALLIGFLNTLVVGSASLVAATVVGLIVGLARTGSNRIANLMGLLYVETFRNIPLIVQMIFYYALATHLPGPREAISVADAALLSSRGIYLPGLSVTPETAFLAIVIMAAAGAIAILAARRPGFSYLDPQRKSAILLGIMAGGAVIAAVLLWLGRAPDLPFVSYPALQGLNIQGGIRISPEFSTLVASIGIYGGAYVAEIVRGGFKSVGRGQLEAARAVGLSDWQIFRLVQFPLALRAMLPILANQYIWLIKSTTMGIAVGFSDFFAIVSTSINQSGQTIPLIGILMAGFLIINFSLALLFNRINASIAIRGHSGASP